MTFQANWQLSKCCIMLHNASEKCAIAPARTLCFIPPPDGIGDQGQSVSSWTLGASADLRHKESERIIMQHRSDVSHDCSQTLRNEGRRRHRSPYYDPSRGRLGEARHARRTATRVSLLANGTCDSGTRRQGELVRMWIMGGGIGLVQYGGIQLCKS